MHILSDIRIELSAKEVVTSLYQGRRTPPQMIIQTEEAILQARELWQPAVVYDWVEVLTLVGEQILFASRDLGRQISLNIGPHADLMAEAEIALVSVATIGSKLDERIRELNQTGKSLLAYLLDSIGVVALSKVGDVVCTLAEKEAEDRNWGVGPSLSPGSLTGWPLSGQLDLCSILPLNQIDIHLNDHGVLVPLKSASGVIGIGPGYKSGKVGSVCRFCLHAATCWRRQDNDTESSTPDSHDKIG